MFFFPAIYFNYNLKYDLLKKSNNYNIKNLISLNKKNVSVSDILKKKNKAITRINMFWALELITLQKAFSTYKLKKKRKVFYALQSVDSILQKKNTILFLYNFFKNGLFSVPYLNFFFITNNLRNLKIETISVFEFVKQNYKLFYNVTDIFFTLRHKNNLLTNLWLSLYKIVL